MPQNWIHKLNSSNSRKHKEDVINQAFASAKLGAEDAKIFLQCAWYAYNPFEIFNVKQVPTTIAVNNVEDDFAVFLQLLDDLKHRKVTGNAASAYIERISFQFNSDYWNSLLRPTLVKDLRIGATIKTFNKILKGSEYEIPIFEAQLAVDSEDHIKKLVGKKIIEQKLDGVRALAIVDRSFPERPTVEIFSRNGKPLDNFPHIEEELAYCLKQGALGGPWHDTKHKQFVIDGEIVSKNFQALMKQTQRKTNIDTSDSVFTIFDLIPFDYFNKGKWNVSQQVRTNTWLSSLRQRVDESCKSLHVIEGLVVDLDTKEGHDTMRAFAQDQVDMGYEGIMIKNVDAPYQCKRGTNWMKWKPTITLDLTIAGFEEGTGKNLGRLGALVCEGIDNGKEIKVNVGSGITDAQREDFWSRQAELKGFIVEIKADAITKSQDGDYYSLRFPRFVRFRGFEAGEKI